MRQSLVALGLSLGAFADSATAPPSVGGLTLEARPSHFDTNIGLPARVTYTLRNDSDGPQTLVFSGCGLRPYITTLRGTVMYPEDGVWVCGAGIETVTLAPGQALTTGVYIAGGDTPSYQQSTNTLLLPAGLYRAFAEASLHLGTVDGPNIQLRSRSAAFQVKR